MALPAIPTDFIAHWPGTISGSTLVEETGNYHGVIFGGVTRDIGRVGESADYNGSTGYVDLGAPAGLTSQGHTSDLAFFAFVTPSNFSSTQRLLQARGAAENLRYGVSINTSGQLYYDAFPPAGVGAASTMVLSLTQTNAIGVVRDVVAGKVHFWVNGVKESVTYTESYSGGAVTKICLGAVFDGTSVSGYFAGGMNRVRLYDYVPSDDEVKAIALERPTIPTANLVAAYNFADMAAGIVPDSAPGADGTNDITITGSTPKRGGKSGIMLDFAGNPSNGVRNRWGAPSTMIPLTGDFTFSQFIRPDGVDESVVLAGFDNTSSYHYFLVNSATGAMTYGTDTTTYTVTAGAISAADHHVAFVRSGSVLECFLDGISVGTIACATSIFYIQSICSYTSESSSTNSQWMHGGLKIYSAALTPSEIALLATERQATPTLGLVSHWTMDDVQGATLIDEMGANNGTITGATQVAGQLGQALSFDGVDDKVTTPLKLPLTGEFTVSAFAYVDILPNGGQQVVFAQYDGTVAGPARMLVRYNGVLGQFDLFVGGVATTAIIVTAGWLNVSLSRAGSTFTLKVNDESRTLTNSSALDDIGLSIASRYGGGVIWGGFLSGYVDTTRAYITSLGDLDKLALANESASYTVAGTVTESALPVIRTLRVYNSTTGALLATDVSAADGTYSIALLSAGTVHVMAVGDTGEQTLVHGPVTIA